MVFEKIWVCVYQFYIFYSLAPSNHVGTLIYLVIVQLYQGSGDHPGPSWTQKWTPKGTLQGKFLGTLDKKGPGRVPSWPKLINFFR